MPRSLPSPVFGKNSLPRNQSLVPKRLGTDGLQDLHCRGSDWRIGNTGIQKYQPSKKSAGNFLNTTEWNQLYVDGGCHFRDKSCLCDFKSVQNNRYYTDTGTSNMRRKKKTTWQLLQLLENDKEGLNELNALSHPGNFLVITTKFGLKNSVEREENEAKKRMLKQPKQCSVLGVWHCHFIQCWNE